MVKIRIDRDKDRRIIGFSSSGHSGYAKKGEDIVCAGVSAILQTALMGLRDYLSLEVDTKRGNGYLKVSTGNVDKESRRLVDAILETMVIGLRYIEQDYKGYVKVIEEGGRNGS